MATKINTPVAVGEFATFGFTTDLIEPYRFQWKRNGVFVGRNEKSYTTPPLRPEDYKAKYSVMVWGQDKMEESAEIVLADAIAKPPVKPVTPSASTSTGSSAGSAVSDAATLGVS